MVTRSPCRDPNHGNTIFVRDAAQVPVSRREDNDPTPFADERITETFTRCGRPPAERRVFVIDEQIGHWRAGLRGWHEQPRGLRAGRLVVGEQRRTALPRR